MANLNIVNGSNKIVFGEDSKVIEKYFSGIKGGRVLDTAGFTDGVIKAGHVVITDGKGNYKPMPVQDGAYASLPETFQYAGVVYRSVSASKPSVSIMTNGEVNIECVPYKMDSILAAFKAACPLIVFVKDEENSNE